MEVNKCLVEGREDIYIGLSIATKSGALEAVPKHARDSYINLLCRVTGWFRPSFYYFRAVDDTIPQVRKYLDKLIAVPDFMFSRDLVCGPMVEMEWQTLVTKVSSLIIPV